MARIARITIDLTLVTLTTARPYIAQAWAATKSVTVNTKLSKVVAYFVQYEPTITETTDSIVKKLRETRNSLLPQEEKYLERQIEFIKKKMKDATCKFLRPRVEVAWQYAKVEMAPPMTTAFLNGPAGQAAGKAIGKFVDKFINAAEATVKEMDAMAENKRKAVIEAKNLAAAKLAQEKKVLEERKKAAEKKLKQIAERKQAGTEKKAESKADAGKKAEVTKAEAKKPQSPEPSKSSVNKEEKKPPPPVPKK